MSGRFVVRPQARRDIRDLADSTAADDLEASGQFIDEVYGAFQLLATMPQPDGVEVIRVLHGAGHVERLLGS